MKVEITTFDGEYHENVTITKCKSFKQIGSQTILVNDAVISLGSEIESVEVIDD